MRKFDYGTNQDGYWCYEHIIIQLEDVVDVLRCLGPYNPMLTVGDEQYMHFRPLFDSGPFYWDGSSSQYYFEEDAGIGYFE